MADYTRQLPNTMWVAKRGYVYYLYDSLEEAKRDDEEVSHNLERIRNGIPVFNRCYCGSWLFYSRRMREVKDFINEIERRQPCSL